MEVTNRHDELEVELKKYRYLWRKPTIEVDGRDNVGKSCLGRYLAWKLDLSVIETDL